MYLFDGPGAEAQVGVYAEAKVEAEIQKTANVELGVPLSLVKAPLVLRRVQSPAI